MADIKLFNKKGIRGVDVAGQGRDSTVFMDKFEKFVYEPQFIIPLNPDTAHMETSSKINKDADKFDDIFIDTIGEGSGVYAGCREAGIKNVHSFKNSYGAKGLTDATGTMKFKNMRAYVYWALRDDLNPQFNSELMLPPSDELKAQLAEPKYSYDRKTGELIIEPKEDIASRLGSSPDEMDALTQCYAPKDRMMSATKNKNIRPPARAFGF